MTHERTLTQKERLIAYLAHHTLARARDLAIVGVTRTTIQRALAEGAIERVGRGTYQLVGADMDAQTSLAEVSKQAPTAVICLLSALAFHGLTDQMPRKVWIAIGRGQWAPKLDYPPIRAVRFREPYFSSGIEIHEIGGVKVQVYSVVKSIADAFRNPKLVDRSVAIESLKSALGAHKATPADLSIAAKEYGVAKKIIPYLEALTSNG